ncbi:TnsA endonuclease N-terminal domain-containing protein [Butyrivibrio sp. VCB2006]|uniref:TnsA endonuclease N-terminal domain-containing protein n=1 Tax=Butyrivibrio sp. VCB2006 TaxID=1280679 RepID=UPI0003FF257E|nr:TnsA endonuclease N-terminal domain-containing protein [Butyrivibrio sp. VCB2006]
MAKKESSIEFAFFKFLRDFYLDNKGIIRNRYREITKKYLDYNDSEKNPDAFLRRPQFEALEMYVFIKEFMNNQQMYQIFDDWSKRNGVFADRRFYDDAGQLTLYDVWSPKQYHEYFLQIKKYAEDYPNYIYALTMGLGKTILMATCIFYEFLLASKWPKDEKYCHNALVFAPDKTVLQSLKEIVTFDKSKVVPPEYINILDANIKVHFLEDTGTTLNTLDGSMFNIVISNTQKIILKTQRKEKSAVDKLFEEEATGQTELDEVLNMLHAITNDNDLMSNQRFEKLTRLNQMGIYIDEAHHMFGSDLEKAIHESGKSTSLRTTVNELAKELASHGSKIVACYNYTGTPYVDNKILPEVVYAYGLQEAIANRFLKDTSIIGYQNVKNKAFLEEAIRDFWGKYGGKTYEGLPAKMAIFGAEIEEVTEEIKPVVEDVLSKLGVSLDTILVNVGDSKLTKDEDIRDFNNLDVLNTVGSKKQFILLVNKGREGWNCRSLFSVALFRSPKSTVFVLQATMRCLRKITDEQQTATVYLSKENMDILDDELKKNFRTSIEEIKHKTDNKRKRVTVRVTEPPRTIKMHRLRYEYSVEERDYDQQIDFEIRNIEVDKYDAKKYVKEGLNTASVIKESDANYMIDSMKHTEISLAAEVTKYFPDVKCSQIARMLRESKEGIDALLACVNDHNEIIYDRIVPRIFETLYKVSKNIVKVDADVQLLKKPKEGGCYEFSGNEDLIVTMDSTDSIVMNNKGKSFHADTYVFDSKPELQLFLQLLKNQHVKETYFTGMFTADQTDFYVPYIDPESNRLRKYYPDFLIQLDDGSYVILEVKGDHMVDDPVVKAKEAAAEEIAVESSMKYELLKGSDIMNGNSGY